MSLGTPGSLRNSEWAEVSQRQQCGERMSDILRGGTPLLASSATFTLPKAQLSSNQRGTSTMIPTVFCHLFAQPLRNLEANNHIYHMAKQVPQAPASWLVFASR